MPPTKHCEHLRPLTSTKLPTSIRNFCGHLEEKVIFDITGLWSFAVHFDNVNLLPEDLQSKVSNGVRTCCECDGPACPAEGCSRRRMGKIQDGELRSLRSQTKEMSTASKPKKYDRKFFPSPTGGWRNVTTGDRRRAAVQRSKCEPNAGRLGRACASTIYFVT